VLLLRHFCDTWAELDLDAQRVPQGCGRLCPFLRGQGRARVLAPAFWRSV